MDFFSAAGISSWQDRLNASPEFADAARKWRGRLLLIETDGAAAGRTAWVAIDSGRCTEARRGATGDEAIADYVLAAEAGTWSDLVSARLTPAAAALKGVLHLLKGDVISLIPHAKAAAALLAAAAGEPS